MKLKSRSGPSGFVVIIALLTIYFLPTEAQSSDVGNCLLCHKYPGLSRVDENAEMRLLYVNEDLPTMHQLAQTSM